MRNIQLMKKVIDLDTEKLTSREHSLKNMLQLSIIRKAFGVKNDETDLPVKDYEREIVLSDDEIKEQFASEVKWLNKCRDKGDIVQLKVSESHIEYFLEAVRFFNTSLADELLKTVNPPEKLFRRYDDLEEEDEREYYVETLKQMKEWLIDFWDENPNEDDDEDEQEENRQGIKNSDQSELFERMAGVGYSFDELDEDGNVVEYEWENRETRLMGGYIIKSEKVELDNPEDEKVLMTITHGEGGKVEQINTNIYRYHEIHEEYIEILRLEIREKVDSMIEQEAV